MELNKQLEFNGYGVAHLMAKKVKMMIDSYLVAIVAMGRMLGHVPRIGTFAFGIRIGSLVLVSLVTT
jgi:hypothetical protein